MREFTNMMDLADEVSYMVERQIQGMRRVSATELGLDQRCGFAYVDEDMECIVVDDARARSFDYYGGFEYVDSEDKRQLGDYVIYSNTSERVSEALECLMEKDGLCDSDDGYEDRGLETCRD
jgi:hypothetical protein